MTEKSMIMNRKRNRKQCMVKRYSCLFTAILITFLILAVSLSICFTVNADQEKPKRHAYKYYTDIVIQKGESLWDIANEHMTEEYAHWRYPTGSPPSGSRCLCNTCKHVF